MSEVAFDLARFLTAAGSPSPGPEARTIVAHVLGVDVSRLPLIDAVTPEQQARIDALAARRAAGEPVQHLTGEAHFRYETLSVGPGVFIPRPETEVMVGWALDALSQRQSRRVVELCAGSGAISAALLGEIGSVEAHAVEIDPVAYGFLETNLAGRGADLVLGDMAGAFRDLDATVDLVIANPPYIPTGMRPFLPSDVVEHDPSLALFSGPDGLGAIRQVADVAHRLLAHDGLVATEHDDSHQAGVLQIFRDRGFVDVAGHPDLTGRPRFVTARRG